jgi:hypothetical protein
MVLNLIGTMLAQGRSGGRVRLIVTTKREKVRVPRILRGRGGGARGKRVLRVF